MRGVLVINEMISSGSKSGKRQQRVKKMEFSLPFSDETSHLLHHDQKNANPWTTSAGVIVGWAFWLQSLFFYFTPSYYSQIIIDGTLWDKLSESHSGNIVRATSLSHTQFFAWAFCFETFCSFLHSAFFCEDQMSDSQSSSPRSWLEFTVWSRPITSGSLFPSNLIRQQAWAIKRLQAKTI